jgi:nucleotide-binding universal stress UspA family protein
MNTYLVPTDFSENANNAIEYAAEIAHATGRRLLLLHVHTPLVSPFAVAGPLISEDLEAATQYASEKLDIIRQTLHDEYPEMVCLTMVTIGNVVDQVVSVAENKSAELIIMGTYGTKNLESLLFGNNTSMVIERANCPVLSVPFDVPFRVPYKMLFATNFAFHDLEGVTQMAAVARAFDAQLTIAHVMTDDDARDHEEELMHSFLKEIRSLTDYEKINNILISDKTVNEGLDAIVAETKADMIAISMQKRGIFEQFFNPGIARKFASHSVIPLLAFHGHEEMHHAHH